MREIVDARASSVPSLLLVTVLPLLIQTLQYACEQCYASLNFFCPDSALTHHSMLMML
ncbi:hypothetical protein AB4Z22_10110 [Paenibacillus sp. TAF58]